MTLLVRVFVFGVRLAEKTGASVIYIVGQQRGLEVLIGCSTRLVNAWTLQDLVCSRERIHTLSCRPIRRSFSVTCERREW